MKKILSFVLSLVLVFGIFGGMEAQAAGSVSLSTSTVSAHPGDTVSVSVSVTANSGFAFLMVTPSYDSSALTLQETINGNVCGSMTSGKNPNWNGNGQNITSTGTLVTFKFLVNSDAAVKDYTVGVTVRQCYDASSNDVTCNASNGAIKVSCKTHSFGSWTEVSGATCTTTGKEQRTCSACGTTETRDINALGHNWGSWSQTQAPTCTGTGTQKRTCGRCSQSETKAISATGHSMGSWSTTKEATCTATGTQTRKCSKCTHTETQTIAALGHNFSSPEVTKQPSCTETGTQTGTCTRCKQTTAQSIKATGHKYGSWADKTAATCTAGGVQERKCTKCDDAQTRDTEVLGHEFENPTIVREATISTTGLLEGKCKRCSEATQQVIPCTATDSTSGTSFEAGEGTFAEGTTVSATKVTDEATQTTAKNALADVASTFTLMNVSASLNGAEVQPNGKVKISFAVPDGYSKNLELYSISNEAIATKLEAVVSEDGKTVTVEVDSFGNIAICDLDVVTELDESDETTGEVDSTEKDKEKGNNGLVIGIAVGVVVLLAAAITVIVVIKKKKGKENE